MQTHNAIAAFAALAQESRLDIFRLLMRQAPYGLPAGQIAACLGVTASTLSAHVAQLERAGLLRSWREQRHIFYAADTEGFRTLLTFLTEECCSGHPELCGYTSPGDLLGLEMIGAEGISAERRASMPAEKVYNVLFLCTGNAARSILAECILNRLGQERFRAFSAGSQPKGAIHPYALELLQHLNYPTEQLRSKSWEEFSRADAPPLDFIFTLCDEAAKETCPLWPGQPISAHWGLPDPAAVDGTEAEKRLAFLDTMRLLNNRITIFVNLPVAKLDQLSLRQRMDAIGKTTPHPAQL